MYGYTHLHRGDLNENGNFEYGKLVMHGYNHFVWRRSWQKWQFYEGNQSCFLTQFAWGRFNENGNFRNGELTIHGSRILHGCDLNGNENFKNRIIEKFFLPEKTWAFLSEENAPCTSSLKDDIFTRSNIVQDRWRRSSKHVFALVELGKISST